MKILSATTSATAASSSSSPAAAVSSSGDQAGLGPLLRRHRRRSLPCPVPEKKVVRRGNSSPDLCVPRELAAARSLDPRPEKKVFWWGSGFGGRASLPRSCVPAGARSLGPRRRHLGAELLVKTGATFSRRGFSGLKSPGRTGSPLI